MERGWFLLFLLVATKTNSFVVAADEKKDVSSEKDEAEQSSTCETFECKNKNLTTIQAGDVNMDILFGICPTGVRVYEYEKNKWDDEHVDMDQLGPYLEMHKAGVLSRKQSADLGRWLEILEQREKNRKVKQFTQVHRKISYCCAMGQVCWGICGVAYSECTHELKTCMKKQCSTLEDVEDIKECVKISKNLYGLESQGDRCALFEARQRESCECYSEEERPFLKYTRKWDIFTNMSVKTIPRDSVHDDDRAYDEVIRENVKMLQGLERKSGFTKLILKYFLAYMDKTATFLDKYDIKKVEKKRNAYAGDGNINFDTHWDVPSEEEYQENLDKFQRHHAKALDELFPGRRRGFAKETKKKRRKYPREREPRSHRRPRNKNGKKTSGPHGSRGEL